MNMNMNILDPSRPLSRRLHHHHHASLSDFDSIKVQQEKKASSLSSHNEATSSRIIDRPLKTSREGYHHHHHHHHHHDVDTQHVSALSFHRQGESYRHHRNNIANNQHPYFNDPNRRYYSYQHGARTFRYGHNNDIPHQWLSFFNNKPAYIKRRFIQHPSVYPVCTIHLAAIVVQRWWRSLPEHRRIRRSTRRKETIPQWIHPYQKLVLTLSNTSNPTLSSTSVINRQPLTQHQAAIIIQRSWKASRIRRWRKYARRRTYHIAARSIQHFYHNYRERLAAAERFTKLKELSAIIIQRTYRAHTNRRIYQFFRDLIRSREAADPIVILRALTCGEALVYDATASGLYVRFRLGGPLFPPLIYYKIYTKHHITDINAFAPRDYAYDKKQQLLLVKQQSSSSSSSVYPQTDIRYWYQRWENNGWRIVASHLLAADPNIQQDAITIQTAARRTYHHPNPLIRIADQRKKRKEKKIEWMKKLYAAGRGGSAANNKKDVIEESKEQIVSNDIYSVSLELEHMMGIGKLDQKRGAADIREDNKDDDDIDWEYEAHQLLDWADHLNYDSYQLEWNQAATSQAAVPRFRVTTKR